MKDFIKLVQILKEKYFSSCLVARKKKGRGKNPYIQLMVLTCHCGTMRKELYIGLWLTWGLC